MKILLICTTPSWGGLEQTAYRDAVQLTRRGIIAEVLCLNEGRLPEACREAGIRTHQIRNKSKHFNPEIYFKLKKLMKEENYDVVHFHSFNILFPALFSLMGEKVKVVATRHIYVEHKKKDLFHKWYLNRIDKMLAISEFSRTNILETYPLFEDKVETCYLGIDLSKYSREENMGRELRNKWGLPKDVLVAGVVGRIDPAKGQMEFVESLPAVIKEHPGSFFIIAGRTTSEEEEGYLVQVKAKVKELGISKRVLFTGFIEDVRSVLSSFDVLVMPSYFEAFGLVAIEAMACSVPVIATNMGSIEEIMPTSEHGLRISPRSSTQISEALITLFNSPELRASISRTALKNVRSTFDESRYFDRLITIYKEAGAKHE